MMNQLTQFQKEVLKWIASQQQGSVRVAGRWVWPSDIRRDPRLAEEIYHLSME